MYCFPLENSYNSISSMSFNADGKHEAILKLTSIRGDTASFMLVSSSKYHYNSREDTFFSYFAKLLSGHPNLKGRSPIFFYPKTYMVYQDFLIIPVQKFTTIQDLIGNETSIRAIMEASKDVNIRDMSPAAFHQRRKYNISDDVLFRWFVKGASGSLTNYCFMRNSFASCLGSIFSLRMVFNSPLSHIPTLTLFNDRVRVSMSEIMSIPATQSPLPFTSQICGMRPAFVLHGSFATAFLTNASVYLDYKDEIALVLQALSIERKVIQFTMHKAKQMASSIDENTDKFFDPFPFAIVEYIIETSSNAFKSQSGGFAWLFIYQNILSIFLLTDTKTIILVTQHEAIFIRTRFYLVELKKSYCPLALYS